MYSSIKRVVDIIAALIALVILSPVFLLIMIILLFTGEHEIFYRQKRVGYQNKPFYIWKFATMLKNSSKMGTGEITVRNDPRVTAFGKFLRISKINELPQLINILEGNMSLVGPRPLMKVSFELYSDEVKNNIYKSKPGITGIGSLIFRDEEKILSDAKDPRLMYAVIYPYKGELELWYLKNASFLVDMKIIFLTAYTILVPQNHLAGKIFKDLPVKDFEFAP
ncbi:MAG: sugar transferase [Ginsengibacter sp.]